MTVRWTLPTMSETWLSFWLKVHASASAVYVCFLDERPSK